MALELIIPPQHQSAPKGPVRLISPFEPTPAPAHTNDLDAEMDNPAYHDPAVVAWAQKRDASYKSPEQTIEALLKKHEENLADERTQRQRWAGQERWQGKENEEMRLVHIIHPHTFIDKLRRAGVNALREDPYDWYRENKIDAAEWPKVHARLWLNSFSVAGRVGVTTWLKGEMRTLTSLQYPYGPEYSIMRFNEWNVPTNEKYRGWRTALLGLIIADVISEEEAERAFGPALGPASDFYREQLFIHRSQRYGLRQ